MPRLPGYFRILLVAMGLVHLGRVALFLSSMLRGASGLVYADDFNPVGGDFINLFAAARLVIESQADAIYASSRFAAFEHALIGPFAGVGVWVYPPPSLLLIWPFGLPGFVPGLVAWSAVGIVVMGLGAWRAGFKPIEILLLLLAPATVSCVALGQTSNVFLGLLLIALSTRDGGRPAGGVAAALLTLKPQLGFALPVIFLLPRQWRAMLLAALVALILEATSAVIFGVDVWRSYIGDSLALLGELERSTTGPFMLLEPSVFMAGRILTGDAELAFFAHAAVAAGAAAYALWRVGSRTADQQAAVALAATALITPYFHSYDGGLVLCAALLAARRWEAAGGVPRLVGYFVVIGAWALPDVTQVLNERGLPVGPLILIAVLLLAGEAPSRSRDHAGEVAVRSAGVGAAPPIVETTES